MLNFAPLALVDRFPRSFLGDIFSELDAAPRRFGDGVVAVSRWRTTETEGGVTLSVDLPGITPEEVELSLTGRRLSLRAGFRPPSEKREQSQATNRRTYTETFILPEWADTDTLQAKLAHGVLDLVIPKKAESSTRKIEISAG